MKKWDELSSRQKDALVAEKVMGRDDKAGVCAPRRGTIDDTFGRVLPDGYHERTSLYTTDISAAWEVVEKLKSDYYINIDTSTVGWNVLIERVEVECASAPEAICLAALRAVGVEV